MSEGLTAIIGVIVGFLLNEASKLFKDCRLSKRLKKALEDELNTNLYQLDQKIDIANQMVDALVNGRDKLSQKWSFKSEPLWKGCGINSKVSNLIPGLERRLL